MRIEFEREDKLPLAKWEEFVRLARQAGAGDDTPVDEVMCDGSSDVLRGWRVELSEDTDTGEPGKVTLPAFIVQELMHVAKTVAESDGDVRGLEDHARTVLDFTYEHLLKPVLGENPHIDPFGEPETK
jgi:hypothetical protein